RAAARVVDHVNVIINSILEGLNGGLEVRLTRCFWVVIFKSKNTHFWVNGLYDPGNVGAVAVLISRSRSFFFAGEVDTKVRCGGLAFEHVDIGSEERMVALNPSVDHSYYDVFILFELGPRVFEVDAGKVLIWIDTPASVTGNEKLWLEGKRWRGESQ